MTDNIKKVYRNKVGLEDLLIGIGTETQTRNNTAVTITKINAANLPFDETTTFLEKVTEVENLVDNAAQSVLDAEGSANAAAQSVIEANNIKTEVEAIYDNFDDRYLGAKTVEPTLDNDGDPLQIGAIYYNLITKTLKFYDGNTWDDPEVAASAAALAASNSATSAANSFDSFDDRYLGAKSSNPSTDNDGDPLLIGALYYSSVNKEMRVWSGTSWDTAYVSLSGALINTNNLDDLTDVAQARANINVYSKNEIDNFINAIGTVADFEGALI